MSVPLDQIDDPLRLKLDWPSHGNLLVDVPGLEGTQSEEDQVNTSAGLCCSSCGADKQNELKLLPGAEGMAVCLACVREMLGPPDLDALLLAERDRQHASQEIKRRLRWGPINTGAGVRARFRCEYCDRNLLRSVDDYYAWQIDHIVPGGGDADENIALACSTCNHLKHTFVPVGDCREQRVECARKHIGLRRVKKQAELEALRKVLGLPGLSES